MYFIHSITNNILYSWRGSTTLQDNSNTNNFPEVIPKSRINSSSGPCFHFVGENSTSILQWQLNLNQMTANDQWESLTDRFRVHELFSSPFLCWGRLGKMLSADIFCPRWSSLIWAAGTQSRLVTWDTTMPPIGSENAYNHTRGHPHFIGFSNVIKTWIQWKLWRQ